MNVQQLNNELGNIDLYLLDQILKDRFPADAKILDAGCGEGRNLTYFLNNRYDVYGIDQNEDAIRMLHFILGSKYPQVSKSNFTVGSLSDLPYGEESFDYITCSAVLHFSSSHEHFWSMFDQLNHVLKKGGQLFIRMTSEFGLDNLTIDKNGQADLKDGSIRYLLTQSSLDRVLNVYDYELIEPVKSVLVSDMRSMSTLILRKG